jgi:BCD family chlorophyll transporter-like MFS transporter
MSAQGFGWVGIARLGLVQAMLGAVVVLTTSTLNRVMVVELALPALVPGLLVALHHAVQLSRPGMGFGADLSARRTRWIAGGMAVLAAGGLGAAVAVAWMDTAPGAGLALAIISFTAVGIGVSAAGTSVLTLLAKRVAAPKRASAAAAVWVMMIVGLAGTAGIAGQFLDPYTPARLVSVSATVSAIAVVVTLAALWGIERTGPLQASPAPAEAAMTVARFRAALAEVWAEQDARRFTVFVFVSMLAYSAQDLILEPFAGMMFGLSPGETTRLSGLQHGGVLAGMLLASLAGRRFAGVWFGSLRTWSVWGCLASCVALLGLTFAGLTAEPDWPLRANVFVLGVANGAFSIAAIGSMMALAGRGRASREGTRMGLWGASQAIAFAVGGVTGTAVADLARWILGDAGPAYSVVFAIEALLFVASARLAASITAPSRENTTGIGASPVTASGTTLEGRP